MHDPLNLTISISHKTTYEPNLFQLDQGKGKGGGYYYDGGKGNGGFNDPHY